MNAMPRKLLIASFVTALVSSPGWAAGTKDDAYKEPAGQTGQTMERGAATGQSGATMGAHDEALYSMTPDQIEKMDVIGAAGEEVGDVKAVVRSQSEDNIQVVIGAGGFLGVGERDIAVPLDQLKVVGDKLQLSATKEELQARPEYQEDQYVELEPADQPISDFAAFEPTPGQEGQSMQRTPGQQQEQLPENPAKDGINGDQWGNPTGAPGPFPKEENR